MSNPLPAAVVAGLIEDSKEDWREQRAANGIPYYYNVKTKKSQWEKPDCLKTPEEKLNSTGWQELTTSDGKTFYYNAKLRQSVWRMPPELKAIREKQAELRKQMLAQGDSSKNTGNKISFSFVSNIEQGNEGRSGEYLYLPLDDNKQNEMPHEEAVKIFLNLLKERAHPAMKWEQVHNLLHEDERYKVIKSFGEKKKIFKDWVNQTKQQERNETRQKLEKAKENFRQMLEEKGILSSDSKFYKVAHHFVNDPRWKALEDRDRENIFQDYLDDLFQKEKEEKRQKRKELSEKLRNMLAADSSVTSSTKWNEINEKYKNNPVWNELGEYDRLLVFSEYILDLDKKEYDEKRKNRRTQERKNREAFRELLKEYIEQGKLIYKTKWRNFVQIIKDDPRFLNMLGQPGSTPRELFEDQIEILKDQHKRVKDELKKVFKELNFSLQPSTTFEEFNEKLKDNEIYNQLDGATKKVYFEYFMDKAKSKEKSSHKKHKKLVKKFNKFLKSLSGLTSESQYQNHEQTIEENIEFSGLSKEEKQQLFQEYVQSLKMEDEGQISEGERDKSKKKKAKKKKKTHRRDSSEEDGYSSEASRHRSESKSRSRSRSKERKKRKEKRKADRKSGSLEKEKEEKNPEQISKELDSSIVPEQQPNESQKNLEETIPKTSEPGQIQEAKPEEIKNEAATEDQEEREEGEETKADIPRIIRKSISKSSSVSRERSKKKKEKKHSKKKSKKSDKKSKKKKKKRDSSPTDSSDSEDSS